MEESRRLVVLDPGLASSVGHHSDVNACLLSALRLQGWQLELWADAQAAHDPLLRSQFPELRPLLREAGYLDPRHWCDLAGCLHQAARLHPQLEAAAATQPETARLAPVAVWLAHSLLPFQLLALAQLLQRQPPAQVVLSLMFAPGEVFAGQPDLDLQAQRQAAELNSRSALAALALAVERGRHQLLLCAGSQQMIECYASLCAAAGLAPPQLHPSLVADAALLAGSPAGVEPSQPRVLLHLGERKPDKGRELALAALERLLSGVAPPVLQQAQWCFHAASHKAAASPELEVLARAAQRPGFTVLEGPLQRAAMLQELASADVLLLPYCPLAYAKRSSGVLWLYGAARLAQGLPARVVGYSGGWLAAEAAALGLHWQPLPQEASAAEALAALALALEAPTDPLLVSPYGRQVLGSHWGAWLAQRLSADRLG